jgi:hypothetical protein
MYQLFYNWWRKMSVQDLLAAIGVIINGHGACSP